MKLKIMTMCFVLLGTILYAQSNVEAKETLSSGKTLYLNFKFAQDIKIVHGNANEVIVKASVNIDEGEGDEFFSIKTHDSSGQLKMYSDFGGYFKKRQKVYYNDDGTKTYSRNDCNTTNINYVVYVPKNVNLKIKSISGGVTIDNFQGDLVTDLISGDVTIKKFDGELRLKTISGALDVTVDKAKLNAKSLTGTIYSDLDFEKSTSKGYNGSHNKVSKSINGGTLPLKMETISGNIYIRKG
jgi:hypothetical protein